MKDTPRTPAWSLSDAAAPGGSVAGTPGGSVAGTPGGSVAGTDGSLEAGTDGRIPHVLDLGAMAGFDGAIGVVSTRVGGVSRQPYDSMNVGFHVGDSSAAVIENRRRLFASLGIAPASVVGCRQVHGSAVRVVTKDDAGRGGLDLESALDSTDAMVTAEPGICLMIVVADCVPLLVLDPVRRVMAVAHAGWSGTALGVAEAIVREMSRSFGCRPADMVAALGPAICRQHYEVGPEVIAGIDRTQPAMHPAPHSPAGGDRHLLDLRDANAARLAAAGVPAEHVHMARECTFEERDLFFSHRRSGAPTGRVAACAMLRP